MKGERSAAGASRKNIDNTAFLRHWQEQFSRCRVQTVSILLALWATTIVDARAQNDFDQAGKINLQTQNNFLQASSNPAPPQSGLTRAQKELPTPSDINKLLNNQEVDEHSGTNQTQIRDRQDPLSTIRPALPTPNSQGVLTLHGAVEQAITLNQDIARDRLEVSRLKWDYIAAQSARLPNIRTISYLSQQTVHGDVLIPAQANAFVFVSAMLPVTQQYRLGLEARAFKIGREIAQYKLLQETDDTQAKVKEIYYKLALDQTRVSTLDVTLKYLAELQTTTSNRVKEGNALKVDSLKVQSTLEKAQLDLMRAQHTLQIDREKFNHLLGRDLSTTTVLETIPPPDAIELNIEHAEQRALGARPEIKAADARRRQINLEKKIRLSEYIPNVSVGAVYITLPGFNNQVLPRNVFAPGLFITYDAFDWGRKAFLAKAQGKSEQAQLAHLASIRDEVLIDLHGQINKLTEARLSVKTAKFARDVALEDLRVSMNRYKFTSEKLAEVLAAHTALATANDQYEQSLLAFWEAKAEFDRAVGS